MQPLAGAPEEGMEEAGSVAEPASSWFMAPRAVVQAASTTIAIP